MAATSPRAQPARAALPREARAAIAAMALCQIYLGVDATLAVRRAASIVEAKLRALEDDPLARLDVAMRGLALLDPDETAAELVDASGEARLVLA